MSKLFSYLKTNRTLLAQLLLVVLAFLVMVLIGSYYGAVIVNKNIAYYGDEVINASAETLRTYLRGHEITLDDVAFSIEREEAQHEGLEGMRHDLTEWTNWLQETDIRFSDFLYLYGVVDGKFIDGSNWAYPDDYDPTERVWYKGAYEMNGATCYSDPYIDAHTGENVMTLSRVLFNDAGEAFGVIALDVYLSSISDYISHMKLLNSGYGMLLDSERRFIIHPGQGILGRTLESLEGEGTGYSAMADILDTGGEVSAFNYTSVFGDNNVAFFQKLFNGWYIGVASPSSIYYGDVNTMRAVLSVTAFIMMLMLCGVLVVTHIAKTRSDTASQVKSSFLANMSHEIRTPMNAVIGMSELLMHEPLNDRQMHYVNDINSSARSLLSIINDILDLSKIESGKLELNPVNYDFHALVDNINSMFKYVANKKELEFRFECSKELPKILYGDDIRLRQVLTNICGNAIKFTEKGYVRLRVSASGDSIMFEVKDTGIGIRKEDVPKLFNAFAQAKGDKNRSIMGTGLGLAISKAFVEMMGGNIMLDSEYGQGTVITVMIPIVQGSETDVKHEDNERKVQSVFAPSARILVVDDNDFNLAVALGMLKLFDIDAKTANSGIEAIETVKANDFDIVFMDHMMPDMDGIEATGEIRKLGEKFKRLTIIALTANAIHGAKEMFLANGFNGFISKPIDLQELTALLIKWLPENKIISEPTAGPNDVQLPGTVDAIAKISEINTKIGLSRVSDIEEMYVKSVENFCGRLIGERDKLTGFLGNEDYNNFTISIHAMKSMLSTIGAMDLSEAAFKMEASSKKGDCQYCIDCYPMFCEKLTALYGQLREVFPESNAELKKEPGDRGALMEYAQKALAAADEFDDDAGLEALNELLLFDFGEQNNGLLKGASDAFHEYNFDKAIAMLKQIA